MMNVSADVPHVQGWQGLTIKEILEKGPILQNSISAENFLDKLLFSSFSQS
jgi:hypothetical protein